LNLGNNCENRYRYYRGLFKPDVDGEIINQIRMRDTFELCI